MKIGIDVGGSHITTIGMINNEIISKKVSINNLSLLYQDFLKILINDINEVLEEPKNLETIGIALPSNINYRNNQIINSTNINIHEVNVVDDLKKIFNVNVFIENDANCAALAEYKYGNAKDTESSVTITIGTGIGVGIIINGRIFSGFNYIGSEMGHHVINFNGPMCKCGRKGCFEVYASMRSFVNKVKNQLINNKNSIIWDNIKGNIELLNGKLIFEASKLNDEFAVNMVDEYIELLSIGIANIQNSLMPEVIIIGGGISSQGDYLLELINNHLHKYDFINYDKFGIEKTLIKVAKYDNLAGAIGATLLQSK